MWLHNRMGVASGPEPRTGYFWPLGSSTNSCLKCITLPPNACHNIFCRISKGSFWKKSLSAVAAAADMRRDSLEAEGGCCASRAAGTYPASPSPQPNSSRAAINTTASNTALPRPSTTHTNASHHRPLTERFNVPLRTHAWTARKSKPWTRSKLDRERTAFFDTRVTGRPEIWGAIRAAVAELHAEAKNGGEGGEGTATAQTIIDASGATLPTGDLADGVYDALGAYYAIPEWVVCDPVNVSEEGQEAEVEDEEEGKGKVVETERDTVKVTARLSERGGIDVRVRIGRGDSVKVLARMVAEGSDLPPHKHIKIAYLGKILRDNETLLAQGWREGHMVNGLVFG
ncbi:hypothetical protein V495_05083 [Pseudogymnoascus sp. VKM F-4514 (FW-929)]|nr:hypothetical protein V495_05083 [Pseudogymnoascus sp. VKM F-4514 (FW-929)]KFY53847.1 hypothetical protein V497_08171 [Pseudogymnoascus sp. VKM F-4516 (FW-969)]